MQILTRSEPFDAVIVGSGATGGWVAKQLAEAGLTVAVLDAGSKLSPADYSEHVQPYQTKYRFASKAFMRDRPMQRNNYACEETNYKWWASDVENPYTYAKGREFRWIRLRAVGGRSLAWGRGAFRHSDLDFKAASRDGWGIDWPISYAELEPHYETVERFIGVSGTKEDLPQIPDSIFQPALPMMCGERRLKDAVWKKFRRVVTEGPLRCPHSALERTPSLPPLRALPSRLHYRVLLLFPHQHPARRRSHRAHDAHSRRRRQPRHDGRDGKATGIGYLDRWTREAKEIRGKVVVLAASTLESTRIMLNLRSRRIGEQLGGAGPLLNGPHDGGRLRPRAARQRRAALDWGPADAQPHPRAPLPQRGPGRNQRLHPRLSHDRRLPPRLPHGCERFRADFKRRVRDEAYWRMGLGAFVEHLPQYENNVRLNKGQVDAWGIPTLHVTCEFGVNERRMAADAEVQIAEMLESAGCKDVPHSGWDRSAPGFAIHEVGTARMGSSPKYSVLNKHCQAWDVPNLFVADGASWPTVACQNPTLTMMANAVRISAYIANEAKKGTFGA